MHEGVVAASRLTIMRIIAMADMPDESGVHCDRTAHGRHPERPNSAGCRRLGTRL